jgi:hypothetical protein
VPSIAGTSRGLDRRGSYTQILRDLENTCASVLLIGTLTGDFHIFHTKTGAWPQTCII